MECNGRFFFCNHEVWPTPYNHYIAFTLTNFPRICKKMFYIHLRRRENWHLFRLTRRRTWTSPDRLGRTPANLVIRGRTRLYPEGHGQTRKDSNGPGRTQTNPDRPRQIQVVPDGPGLTRRGTADGPRGTWNGPGRTRVNSDGAEKTRANSDGPGRPRRSWMDPEQTKNGT